MKPKRIQRQRSKGWTMPKNTVYVGRPTKWGNDVKVGELDLLTNKTYTQEDAVRLYEGQLRQWSALIGKENFIKQVLEPLLGKNLACWCKLDAPCHADVLLRLANEQEQG